MAKVWRRAWGWVGLAARRSRMRRTSRGDRAPAPPVEEHGFVGGDPADDQRRPSVVEPGPHRVDRGFAHRHLALLGPLAPDGDHGSVEVEVDQPQPAQLAHPQAAAVEQLEHGGVAQADRLVGRRCGEKGVELGRTQDVGQPAVASRCRQARRRVGGDDPGAAQPAEVAAEGGRLAGDRPAGVAPGGQVGEVAAQDQAVDVARPGQPGPLGPDDELGHVVAVGQHGVGRHRRQRPHEPVLLPTHPTTVLVGRGKALTIGGRQRPREVTLGRTPPPGRHPLTPATRAPTTRGGT